MKHAQHKTIANKTLSAQDQEPKPNPFFDSIVTTPIMEIPSDVEGLIYTR